jgi:hypothetical protein
MKRKVKRAFTIEYHLINDILMDWNPLLVNGKALTEEYLRYIPAIIKLRKSHEELVKYLEFILVSDMGLDYNLSDPIQKREILKIANMITSLR